MVKIFIYILVIYTLSGCGTDSESDFNEDIASSEQRLPQPLAKEKKVNNSSQQEGDNIINEPEPLIPEQPQNIEDWILKKKTVNGRSFFEIESGSRLLSDSGKYKLVFRITQAGYITLFVNRVDGNDIYESEESPKFLSRRVVSRDEQARSAERIREWSIANEAKITVSINDGESWTAKRSLLNNKIKIPENQKINTFIKQSFFNDEQLSVIIDTAKLSKQDSTFRNVHLKGYEDKINKLREILRNN